MSNLSPVEVRDSIYTLLRENFTRCPVAWANRKFDPDTEALNGYWIKPNILMGNTEEGEVGLEGLSFRNGVLKIQVFGPKNGGNRDTWVTAGSLEAIYRREVYNCIVFDEPRSNEIGAGDRHYQLVVDIPFTVLTE